MKEDDPIYSAERETANVYSVRVAEFVSRYESLTFESVHGDVMHLLPSSPAFVLDIGAGTGRDAAWFAHLGAEVVAVEPVRALLDKAKEIHPSSRIQWVQDKLPGLSDIIKQGMCFDLVMLNAVWMHIHPSQRQRAFRKITSLVRAGGTLLVSFRTLPFEDERSSYPCSIDEIESLARAHGFAVKGIVRDSADRLGRADVGWCKIVLQLPDDGTDALPLVRHIILNDEKNTTYKLALLRVLLKIAEGARGVARHNDDGTVSVPLGLVALYWIRMYKPLLDAHIPQLPKNIGEKKLGFDTENFRALSEVSPYDLRIGARFTDDIAAHLHKALSETRRVICDMPVNFTKYPNSDERIFKSNSARPNRVPTEFVIDAACLSQFGELQVPEHVWFALCRFGCWIEPSVVSEWTRLMRQFLQRYDRQVSEDDLAKRLAWVDPERDTNFVKTLAQALMASGQDLHCVWTGKRLAADRIDIDHCFPFSSWPCNDLWNLLPAHPQVNRHEKKDKLISAELLSSSEDRICSWWQRSYLVTQNLEERFQREAASALSLDVPVDSAMLPGVFEGLSRKRVILKRDLQIPEWSFRSIGDQI
jgi:SAM-dependent methyltransferase